MYGRKAAGGSRSLCAEWCGRGTDILLASERVRALPGMPVRARPSCWLRDGCEVDVAAVVVLGGGFGKGARE